MVTNTIRMFENPSKQKIHLFHYRRFRAIGWGHKNTVSGIFIYWSNDSIFIAYICNSCISMIITRQLIQFTNKIAIPIAFRNTPTSRTHRLGLLIIFCFSLHLLTISTDFLRLNKQLTTLSAPMLCAKWADFEVEAWLFMGGPSPEHAPWLESVVQTEVASTYQRQYYNYKMLILAKWWAANLLDVFLALSTNTMVRCCYY